MLRRTATLVPALTLATLCGCTGAQRLISLVQAKELSPDSAPALAAMSFDVGAPVTVRGTVSTLLFAESGIPGFLVVHAASGTEKYAFSTAPTRDLARQGFRRFTLRPGEKITVTGVLASKPGRIGDFTAARADIVNTPDGHKVFDRSALPQ